MASLAPPPPPPPALPLLRLRPSSAPPRRLLCPSGGSRRRTPQGALGCRAGANAPVEGSHDQDHEINRLDELCRSSRREALLRMLFIPALSFSCAAQVAAAAESADVQESLRSYDDEANKFQISIPKEWLVGTGDTDEFKSVTAFYPEEASESNVSVVITGLGPDFTRLESFGKVDAFAETLVSGLDRSWKNPPGVAAKLIDSRAANGLYYIEYTLQNPGERRRHVLTALGVASNGWIKRLYTVTGQFMDDEAQKYRPQIEKAVSSFRLTDARK